MKNILIVLIIFISFSSCNNVKSEKMTPVSSSENEKLVKEYFELFNQHKWKEMAEMYVENADFKDPSLGN